MLRRGREPYILPILRGGFSGVLGLPLYETAQLLNAFDIAVLGWVSGGAFLY